MVAIAVRTMKVVLIVAVIIIYLEASAYMAEVTFGHLA